MLVQEQQQQSSDHTSNYNDARRGGGALNRKKGSAAPITGGGVTMINTASPSSPIKNIDVTKASKLAKLGGGGRRKQPPLTIREIESPVRTRKPPRDH